jgi:hypothetical protein
MHGRGRYRLRAALAVVAVLIAAPGTQAGEPALIVNGTAIHLDPPPGSNLNEQNYGAGFQYDFNPRGKWVPFATAAGFKDSNRNMSYYAGGGAMWRNTFGDGYRFDVGAVAFLMTREGFKDGDPFPGALPVVSMGTERVALNVTYVPRVDPKSVPLFFFQLKIGLGGLF